MSFVDDRIKVHTAANFLFIDETNNSGNNADSHELLVYNWNFRTTALIFPLKRSADPSTLGREIYCNRKDELTRNEPWDLVELVDNGRRLLFSNSKFDKTVVDDATIYAGLAETGLCTSFLFEGSRQAFDYLKSPIPIEYETCVNQIHVRSHPTWYYIADPKWRHEGYGYEWSAGQKIAPLPPYNLEASLVFVGAMGRGALPIVLTLVYCRRWSQRSASGHSCSLRYRGD
jgi:hypothetical protein